MSTEEPEEDSQEGTQRGSEAPTEITLREYGEEKGPYRIAISEDTVTTLEERFSEYVDIEFDRHGDVLISGSKHAGVASVHDDLRIIVRPKAVGTNLVPLLQYVRGTDIGIIDRQTKIETGGTFLDSIARLYVSELERVLQLGLYSDYRRRQDTREHLRGRLDIQRQIQRQTPTNTEFEVEYDELTTDIPMNQALYRGADILLGLVEGDEDGNLTSKLIHQKRRLAQHVTVRNVRPHEFADSELTRLNDYYEDAIRIAEMMIRNSLLGYPEETDDESEMETENRYSDTYGFFVDMNNFFEKVVERCSESVASSLGYTTDYQAEVTSVVDPEIGMRPDVVIRDDSGEIALIIDAKWKTKDLPRDEGVIGDEWDASDVRNSDIYQMVSYQLVHGVPGLLLYPGQMLNVDIEFEIQDDGVPPLHAKSLPTDADVEKASDVIEQIENEFRRHIDDIGI